MNTILIATTDDATRDALVDGIKEACCKALKLFAVVDGDIIPPTLDPLPDVLIMTTRNPELTQFSQAMVTAGFEAT
jgi:hypothetical protein